MPITADIETTAALFPSDFFELARLDDSFGDGEKSAAVFLYLKMPNESSK